LIRVFVVCVFLGACASAKTASVLDTPVEAARHRAALASVSVSNETDTALAIAFRTAVPPLQEVGIGKVEAGRRARLAPVPAGEPIVLIARRADGAVLELAPRLFTLDAEWTWEIPKDAMFVLPENAE
jgi:hypothetical protein